MPRADLLALEPEDLEVLSNRGLVKRARAEMESGQLTYELEEVDGAVTVRWSDDAVCRIPAGKGVADGDCSCPATTLCRHLIRSVFAYQRSAGGSATAAPAASPAPKSPPPPAPEAPGEATGTQTAQESGAPDAQAPKTAPPAAPAAGSGEPWDPGTIPDADLERHFKKQDLVRARRLFDDGQVIELVRSRKPGAQVHTLSTHVRFMVSGDLNYTHCDCAESRPCVHVALAVWAFRLLPPDHAGGVVSTHREPQPVPRALLDELEAALVEFSGPGVANAPRALVDRFRRLEGRCREEYLVWPAEALAELVLQLEAYSGHDARFSAERVTEVVAELCTRSDAIRSDTGAVPQLFIRGGRTDRTTDVGSARLVGLGCGAEIRRGSVELAAYFQDVDSGAVVAIGRDFPDPPEESGEPPRELWQLARYPLVKGTSIGALGTGQLLFKGGKRTPSYRFIPGRAQVTFNPQSFQWGSLRPPVLVEDFGELASRLAAQPPASLRPRRVGASLYVCAVAGVMGASFSELDQTLYAVLADASGNAALLAHPYSDRTRPGTDAALTRLEKQPESLRYVAAYARLSAGRLRLEPISLVFEVDGRRTMVQPWTEPPADASLSTVSVEVGGVSWEHHDDATEFAGELLQALGETWLLGLQRADGGSARHWRELSRRGAALGFNRLLVPVERLSEELERKTSTPHWEPEPAARAMLEIAVLASLAHEQAG